MSIRWEGMGKESLLKEVENVRGKGHGAEEVDQPDQ